MAIEKLKFKLELYATMWDKPPVADIKINEKDEEFSINTTTDNQLNYAVKLFSG